MATTSQLAYRTLHSKHFTLDSLLLALSSELCSRPRLRLQSCPCNKEHKCTQTQDPLCKFKLTSSIVRATVRRASAAAPRRFGDAGRALNSTSWRSLARRRQSSLRNSAAISTLKEVILADISAQCFLHAHQNTIQSSTHAESTDASTHRTSSSYSTPNKGVIFLARAVTTKSITMCLCFMAVSKGNLHNNR